MITAINKWANEIRKRSPSQKTDSLFVFTDFSYIYLVTHMTCFTRGRCGRTAAERSFAQFSRKLFADGACVADGSGTFARECFCEGAEVFLDLCRDAVHAAELHQWSQREYELLSAARGIAGV